MADTFDHGTNPMWETMSGGLVSSACGSVEGQALCFNDEVGRCSLTASNPVLKAPVVSALEAET